MPNKSSRALKMAHVLYRSAALRSPLTDNRSPFSWSDIVRHAWYFERFRTWLHEGLVCFTYLKIDNSIRDARGTLCEHLIPHDDIPVPRNPSPVTPSYIIKYYDIDRKGWREFDIRRFVGYVERYPLKERA